MKRSEWMDSGERRHWAVVVDRVKKRCGQDTIVPTRVASVADKRLALSIALMMREAGETTAAVWRSGRVVKEPE